MHLKRSDTTSAGIRREHTPDGFTYIDPAGNDVTDSDRIQRLVIPPAWTNVWVCPDPSGHIQATGRDAAGRLQYLYHPLWHQQQKDKKFDRALDLAHVLPHARAQVTRDLTDPDPTRARGLALAFRLIDSLAIRIGSETYLDAHGSRGLCTLLCRHAVVNGKTLTLRFPSKSGTSWEVTTHDSLAANVIEDMLRRRAPRTRLLGWHTSTEPDIPTRNRWHVLSPEDVNADIRERTGGDFTAKDFRTLHGSALALALLTKAGQRSDEAQRNHVVTQVVHQVAQELGNTPAVARESYIDPRILKRYLDGQQFAQGTRTPESKLVDLLRG
ncbi:MAG TPA: DNA topoisomerase IB [Beutenbergiaceae bacterium]|nr:DNA topoisomerase IB [Beutenbergiaceae bacterium]